MHTIIVEGDNETPVRYVREVSEVLGEFCNGTVSFLQEKLDLLVKTCVFEEILDCAGQLQCQASFRDSDNNEVVSCTIYVTPDEIWEGSYHILEESMYIDFPDETDVEVVIGTQGPSYVVGSQEHDEALEYATNTDGPEDHY